MDRSTTKVILQGLLLNLILLPTANTLAQSAVDLLPLGTGDLAAETQFASPAKPLVNSSREDVSVSWELPRSANLSNTSKPHAALSREYWLTADGGQLQQGLRIRTTAPGAVIKISPIPVNSVNSSGVPELKPEQLIIVDSQGTQHTQSSALFRSATAAQIGNAPITFPPGTVILQLKESLGHGEFRIRAGVGLNSRQLFSLHVLDKNSRFKLFLQASDDTVFPGNELTARITVTDNDTLQAPRSVQTHLLGPDGKQVTVNNTPGPDGSIEALVRIDDQELDTGLWELHVITTGVSKGLQVQRNAKTVFAYSRPNAALIDRAGITPPANHNDSLRISFGLDAIAAGRFELRGTLFGTASDGQKLPMMFASSAGWREAGQSTMTLKFDLDKLAGSRLRGPFEIRDLRLIDQSRMMLLHRQKVALRFQ